MMKNCFSEDQGATFHCSLVDTRSEMMIRGKKIGGIFNFFTDDQGFLYSRSKRA